MLQSGIVLEVENWNDSLKLLALLWSETADEKGMKENIEGHSDTAKHCWYLCHCVARCCKVVALEKGWVEVQGV